MKQSQLKMNCYNDSGEGEVLVNYHGAKLEIIGISHIGDKMILDVLPFTNQLRGPASSFFWIDEASPMTNNIKDVIAEFKRFNYPVVPTLQDWETLINSTNGIAWK